MNKQRRFGLADVYLYVLMGIVSIACIALAMVTVVAVVKFIQYALLMYRG